jgi:hypothetical protein
MEVPVELRAQYVQGRDNRRGRSPGHARFPKSLLICMISTADIGIRWFYCLHYCRVFGSGHSKASGST